MSNNRIIKFRVPILNKKQEVWHWHYWGFIDGKFVPRKNIWNEMTMGNDEEFTGLKDKKGTEVYEGDIVSTNQSKYIWEVFFKEGAFVANKLKLSGWRNIEIIGNIYENKELLK